MAAETPDIDSQDVAEVFDEDNLDSDAMRLARDDEELNFDDMPDVYDVTSAKGDEDDEDAVIGDDLDDDEIVEISTQEADESEDEEDDDAYRASENRDTDDDEDLEALDEVGLSYGGDMDTVPGAHSAAQRYESRTLSDRDLTELGYKDAPKEPKSFRPAAEPRDRAEADHEDAQLDSGLEETFPASDPVSVKPIA
jgi:hypothetical protein